MTKLLLPLAALLFVLCRTASAQSVELSPSSAPLIPPSPPSELVARVYSSTAGAIAWQTPSSNRLVVGYEIVRDGQILGVFDTRSYIERALRPGTFYSYSVTSVDSAGLRSEPAFVELTTTGASLTPAPVMPSGLRFDIYSRTATELFWDRSDVVGQRYQIRRDGQEVDVTDGTSYFDNSLIGTRFYRFEIIALDSEGHGSRPAVVTVRTTDEEPSPPLSTGPLIPPSPPSELVARVYSSTAGAIAWQTPSSNRLVVGYEIVRDGQILGVFDTHSYIERALRPGTIYRYSVTSVDSEGLRSEPALVELYTFR